MVASGNEVGKISIRVVPNLEDFHDDLERQLKAEEKKQRDKAAAKAKVRADTDTSSIPKDVKKAEKSVGNIEVDVVAGDTKKLVSDVEKSTDDFDADVDLKTNLDRFKRRYKNKFQALIADFESNIALTADGEMIRESLKGLEDEFDARLALIDPAKDINTLVRLRREVEKFYRETREEGAELLGKNVVQETQQRLKRLQELTKFEVDLAVQMNLLEQLQEEANAASRKVDVLLTPKIRNLDIVKAAIKKPFVVDVSVEVDERRLPRAVKAWGKALVDFQTTAARGADGISGGLGALQKNFGKATNSILKFGEAGLIVAAVVALAAPAVALLSGALVALPAALAAVAVPMGVIALGLDGIKKAAEVAKPAFEELKTAISDTFSNPETGLIKGFEQIRDRLIPAIKLPLQGVAESLSDAFNGVIDTLVAPEGLNNIQRIFDNVAAGIRTATPGLQSFTDGLNTLVAKLSGGFPGVGEAFSRLGDQFSGWIDKITQNGELDTAMTNLKDTLGEISGLVGDIAKWGWDNLSDPAFGQTMKGFAEDLRSIVNDTLPLLKSGFEDVAAIINGMRTGIDKIKEAGNSFEKNTDWSPIPDEKLLDPKKIMPGPASFDNGWIEGVFGPLGAEIASKWLGIGEQSSQEFQKGVQSAWVGGGGAFGDIGPAVQKQIKDAINVSKEDQAQALRSAFTADGVDSAVSQQLTQQIQAAVQGAKDAMANLGPELQGQIDAAMMPLATIGDKVGEAFSTMGPAVATAWQGVVTELTAGTDQIKTAVTGAFDGLSLSATTAFQGIQDSITGAFGFMVLAIGQQAENINTAVGQAFNQIPETIGTALSGMVQAVPDALSGVPEAVRSALSGVPGAVAGAMLPAIDVVSQVMLGIVNVVTAVGAQVAAVAAATFAQFPPAVQGAMAPAIEAVGSIGQQMVSTALSFAGAMESAGRSIGASFAAGIAGSADLVAGAASALMAAARAFIPSSPAEKGPFSGRGWVTYSGESVGEGFAKGMENSTSGVVSTARELMQAVKDIFGSAEGLTLNFNLGGVTEQAEAATKQVQVFGDTLSKVPTGPLNDLAVASGTEMSSADSEAKRDELSQQLDLLEMERKSLELEKGRAGANNDAIKARLAEIKEQKLQLGLQKDQLDYAKKYGAETEQTGGKIDNFYRDVGEKLFKRPQDFEDADKFYRDMGEKVVSMPTDFAKAIGSQFTQDLGISGQGAIPQFLEQGSQFIFQVANMDTALSAQQTLQRRQGMGLVGR